MRFKYSDILWKIEAIVMALLLFLHPLTISANEMLPEGTVAGLPEGISVLDDEGNSISSDTGRYFFDVEGMVPGTTYTKKIQITNLREDKAYHIYMLAEPISQVGDIDLEDECVEILTLNGSKAYEGKVTGIGVDGTGVPLNMNTTPIDLGYYTPGSEGVLVCDITWEQDYSGDIFTDFGHRLIDSNGTTIISEGNGQGSHYGECKFRWIFYAVVDDDYSPVNTGVFGVIKKAESGVISVMIALFFLIILLLILSRRKKKDLSGKS